MQHSLGKGMLKLLLNVQTGKVFYSAESTNAVFSSESDYFRLFLDDNDEKEILVRSCNQEAELDVGAGMATIRYKKLKAENGNDYDIQLEMQVTEKDDTLCFEPVITNNDNRVRVNEAQYPFVQVDSLGESAQEDVFYYPRAFGMRLVNPWDNLEQYHSEYRYDDQNGIWFGNAYPGTGASMAWYGIQSGSNFFYIAQHDQEARICLPAVGRHPRLGNPYLRMTVASFPAVCQGESISLAPHVLAAWSGDWRKGADCYREFISNSFYKPKNPPKWVNQMMGWQRVIMKHQYGEILYEYKDLLELYRQGRKAGLSTLLVFGWWKGRFDNSYPHYEPDEKMGGAQALKQVIKDIQAEGGRVILYTNGCLIDLQSDFYKQGGSEAAMVDIDGNQYIDHYRFAGQGFTLRQFGYKSFALGCMSTDAWAERLVDQGKVMLEFEPDSIFYDQIAGHPTKLCFNNKHPHGNRVDADWSYRPQVFEKMDALCQGDVALGTENISDIGCVQADYTHNSANVKPSDPAVFPYLFRYTLPEIISTNRTIQEEYSGFTKDLTYAFIFGLRFCVSIFRCRGHLGQMPEYTRHLAKLYEIREQYKEYLLDGRFVVVATDELPDHLVRTEYLHPDGNNLLQIIWNMASEAVTYGGRKIDADGLAFFETSI